MENETQKDGKVKGQKMLNITTRFWTKGLPADSDDRTAWVSGYVYLRADKNRKFKPDMERFENFNEDYMEKLKTLLKRNNITLKLHPRVAENAF